MTARLHNLAPGYYWYSMDNDPYCVLHIREHGEARLMGTDAEVSEHDVAALLDRGCKFFRIEPPLPDAD
ncbi:MAG: hypothetical protein M0R28_14665 [Pigmentiphaga sp.]|nr:hypothetical protein [Pigmentiphaga sp.]